MSLYDPSNGSPRVQHAGTFNGNPMTAAAGISTLNELTPDAYKELDEKGEYVRDKLSKLAAQVEAPIGVTGIGVLVWDSVHHNARHQLQDLHDQRPRFRPHHVHGPAK